MTTPAAQLLDALDRFLEAAAEDRKARTLSPIERKLRLAMQRAFQAQGKAFLTRFAKLKGKFPKPSPAPKTTKPRALREAMEDEDWGPVYEAAAYETYDVMVEAVQVAASAALEAGGKSATVELSLNTSFSLTNPRAVAFLKDYGAQRVTGIDETTRSYLRTVITQAVDEGWSYQRTAKAITARYQQFAVGSPLQHIQSRAELIAVTEAGEAYEAGSMAVAQDLADAGLEMEKSWLTVADGRVDDVVCAGNGRQGWIPLNKDFQSGHSRPLGHPGCRCTLLSRMKQEGRED